MKAERRFWIIWNPLYHLPPTVRFRTREAAEASARIMATQYGDPFYVCEAVALSQRQLAPIRGLKL